MNILATPNRTSDMGVFFLLSIGEKKPLVAVLG